MSMSNCGCPQLNDNAGVESLKALYAREGAGSITFAEKLANNIPVAGVGAAVGIGLGFALNKIMGKK